MESMPRRKLYGKAVGVRLPKQVMEILEREREASGLTYAELVRRAVVAYYAQHGLIVIAPKPAASPPGAGYEGALDGQRGPSWGDEPRLFTQEKAGGGEGG
jgi:hypothetical protein